MTSVAKANGAFIATNPDGQNYILRINHALDFTNTMEHSILCTNQARVFGTQINDVPRVIDNSSSQNVHVNATDDNPSVDIPILYHGCIPYINVRHPTDADLSSYPHYDITCPDEWDPSCLDTTDRRDVGISAVSALHCRDYIDDSTDLVSGIKDAIHISGIKHVLSSALTPEYLAKLWNIPLKYAKATLEATTQDSIRFVNNDGTIHRRVKTLPHQSRYRQLGGPYSRFASDTFKSNVISTRGNQYTQLFCNRGGFSKVYPIKKKSDAHHTLHKFKHEVGIPTEMLTDGALELNKGEWGKICQKHHIYPVTTEPNSPWQNPAEKCGGVISNKVKREMRRTNTPVRLWDYCWEYISDIRSLTVPDTLLSDGVTPYTLIYNTTPNITEYIYFKWFQWVWYYDDKSPDKQKLGRWMGPAHGCGQGLAHNILSSKAKNKVRSTVTALSETELSTPENIKRMDDYMANIKALIGDYTKATYNNIDIDVANIPEGEDIYDYIFEDIDDNDDFDTQELDEDGNPVTRPNIEDIVNDPPYMAGNDEHINQVVILPHPSGEKQEATVKRRKIAADGSLVGTKHSNPILDTRQYEVEFADGSTAEFHSNTITENLFDQVDDQGQQYTILAGICNHKSDDNAVPKERGWIVLDSGARKRVITTKGWYLQVQWKDGTTTWTSLPEARASNPIEVAEYAVAHGIADEPAFAWWVPHTLKKRNNIIAKLQHRAVKKKLKFGIVVPDDIDEAIQLDIDNKNSLWKDAIEKERKNVLVALLLLQDGEHTPIGSKHIPVHWVFDVKFDLTRKARLVAGGHRNKDVPKYVTYSSVVSRESVRICFLLAALNGLDILSADVGNAYLCAKPREKVHTTLDAHLMGPENDGKIAVIVRALYGLKSSGAAWRHTLSLTIQKELGYIPCKADPDVYYKEMVKPSGEKYYAYLVTYVDDILAIDHNPKIIMDLIHQKYRLKGSVEFPKIYLGTDIKKWEYTDGSFSYAAGSPSYLKEAIRVAESLQHNIKVNLPGKLKNRGDCPFSTHSYRPELEATAPCNDEQTQAFQNLIGVLRWLIELGRIDVLHETSLLSQYLASPRIGHLQQAFHIFQYMKKHKDLSWLVFDQDDIEIEWSSRSGETSPWDRADAMKELYPDAIDELPPGMPKPLGKPVSINAFVDADHAGNLVTRRSHTGIMIFVNMAPITWFSKRQNTVESSTFSSEMVALRIATEIIEGLIYKLRMLGVPIKGPARVFCDNESVVKNTSYPESALKKRHCSIAYHKIRESVASGKILIFHESTKSNIADLFTKVLNFENRMKHVRRIMNTHT